MTISSDRRALESLPLRLLIVAVVASMSVVPAAEALETLKDRDFLTRAGQAMDRVIFTAQVLATQGPGARRTIDLDLSSDGSLHAVSLVIGDSPGGAASRAAVLELSSGARLVRLAEDPPAAMTSPFGQGLEVHSSRFSLAMQTVLMDGACVVCVEVV